MKKIKIIGFLVIVLFLSIFVFNESLAVDVGADCLVDTQCVPDFPFCGDNLKCVECKHNNDCKKKYSDGSKPGCVNGVCQAVSVDNSAPRSSKSKSDKSTSGFTPGDARCWTKTDCVEYRKKALKVLDDNDALAGFYSAEDHSDAEAACGKMRGGEVMGFCSPYTEVKTAISFGTVKTFANFGEFVKFIYQYGFLVAGVLAVFMIMVAGIQWLSSAGNQDKIGAAKKRIIGAIVGLLILALSYTILNFINPYLVNFRLPQTWIINKSLMGIEFCHQIPDYNDKEAFKLIGGPNDKLDEGVISSKYKAGNFDLEYNDSFTCGNQYIYSSAPTDKSIICRGSICDENSVCIAMPDKKSYQCQLGVLSGKIHPGDLLDQLFGIWDDNAVNDIDFYAVCNNGERKEVPGSGYKIFKDQNDKQGAYVVTATSDNIKSAMSKCGGPEKTAGFLLYPDFDKRVGKIAKAGLLKGGTGFDFNWFDEPHWLGRRPNIKTDESKAVDLGGKYTDFFKKLANNEKINFMAQDYDAGDFLIPVNYFISNTNQKFQLNIVVKEVKGDTN
ncbi:MAG TPA: pilin [Candidatus Magasanikbacteria bacterium]|nr:pilin [Candidatus Magasanikbacteria bacterium]